MVGFPLLLIPLAVYNIIVFLMRDVSFVAPLATLPLMSGAEWSINLSDILLTLGIFLLLLEVIKGARPGAKYLTDHFLSLIISGAAIAEFLLWPRFANSTFFLLTLLAVADFLSGIALRSRRGIYAAAPSGRYEPPPVEVRYEPAGQMTPPPPVAPQTTPQPAPQPAPVAHPEPAPPSSASETVPPSADVASPGLTSPASQAGDHSPRSNDTSH
jgi:hypothetical protein